MSAEGVERDKPAKEERSMCNAQDARKGLSACRVGHTEDGFESESRGKSFLELFDSDNESTQSDSLFKDKNTVSHASSIHIVAVDKEKQKKVNLKSFGSFSLSPDSGEDGYEELDEDIRPRIENRWRLGTPVHDKHGKKALHDMFHSSETEVEEDYHKQETKFIATKIDCKLDKNVPGSENMENSENFIQRVNEDELIELSSDDSVVDINDLDESLSLSQMLADSDDVECDIVKMEVRDDVQNETSSCHGSSDKKRLSSVSEEVRKLSSEDSDSDDFDILRTTLTQTSFLNSVKKQKSVDKDIDDKSSTAAIVDAAESEDDLFNDENSRDVVESLFEVKHDEAKVKPVDNTEVKLHDDACRANICDRMENTRKRKCESDRSNDNTTDSGLGFFAKKRQELKFNEKMDVHKPAHMERDETGDSEKVIRPVGLCKNVIRSNSCTESSKDSYTVKSMDTCDNSNQSSICDNEVGEPPFYDMYSSIKARKCKEKDNNKSEKKEEVEDPKTVSSSKGKGRSVKCKHTVNSGTVKEGKKGKQKKQTRNPALKSVLSYFKRVNPSDIVINTDSSSSEEFSQFCSAAKCCVKCRTEKSESAKKSVMMHLNVGVEAGTSSTPVSHTQELAVNEKGACPELTDNHDSTVAQTYNTVSYLSAGTSQNETNAPMFEINNYCTVSQNTYAKLNQNATLSEETMEHLGGGFFLEDDNLEENTANVSENDSDAEVEKSELGSNSVKSRSIDRETSSVDSVGFASVDDEDLESSLGEPSANALMEYVTEKVTQIRRNALDILMASGKMLYGKDAKKKTSGDAENAFSVLMNCAQQVKRKTSAVLEGETAWSKKRRGKGQTGYETERDVPKRQCPFYKKIPGSLINHC